MRPVTADQIESLAIGAWILGTGGGGSPYLALLNMRLVNTGDETLPLTRRQKLLRAWAATIAFLLPPLNLIVMHLNKNRLSLPDLISGAAPIED